MSNDRIADAPGGSFACPHCRDAVAAAPGGSCPHCGRRFGDLDLPTRVPDVRHRSRPLPTAGWLVVAVVLVVVPTVAAAAALLLLAVGATILLVPLAVLVLTMLALMLVQLRAQREFRRSAVAAWLVLICLSVLASVIAGFSVCTVGVVALYPKGTDGLLFGVAAALVTAVLLFVGVWPNRPTPPPPSSED